MKDRQALKPKPRLPVMDRCANYNALGRDPDGRLTYLAALFWGRSFVPQCSTQQFVGPPEPPRFGPPAPYQVACLPPGWKPRDPPDFYGAGDAFGPLFLDPPTGIFDPNIFAALKHIARFQWGDGWDSESVDGYSTEADEGVESDGGDSSDEGETWEMDEGEGTDEDIWTDEEDSGLESSDEDMEAEETLEAYLVPTEL